MNVLAILSRPLRVAVLFDVAPLHHGHLAQIDPKRKLSLPESCRPTYEFSSQQKAKFFDSPLE